MKPGKAAISNTPRGHSYILFFVHSKASAITQVDVVTRGDSNPVAKYAKSYQLTSFKWPITGDAVKQHNYDVGVVVSFGRMIPEDVINAFPLLV